MSRDAAPPPSVLHVGKFYPPHMGGIETHLHALCTELRRSIDVQVLVSSDNRRTVREVIDGVPVTRLGTVLSLAAAPINVGLARHIRGSGARIVHIHLPHPAATLACLGSGHRALWVATYHSDIVRQRFLGTAYEPFLHRFLDRCAAIIVTSPNYLASSSVLARHKERVRVVPYGIGWNAFESVDEEKVADLRRRFGERVVVAVGRLIYYKGFEYLIEAMRGVRGHLVIVGDGPRRASLEALAIQAGVRDRVTFAGEIQNRDIAPFYHAADVFALPSSARSEAFGIVQLEAMACGLPVVNTALDSGVPYVSVHGRTGLTVAPRDPAALAAALARLLDDEDLRRRLGEAARARVREHFSLEALSARILALYQELDPSVFDPGALVRPSAASRVFSRSGIAGEV